MPETLDKTDAEGQVIDYLEEDAEIPTQRYGIISFLSPEKVIKQKSQFMHEKFIQWLEYDWKIEGMERFMDFMAKKYSLKIDDLMKDLQEFTKVHNADIKKTDIMEKYQVFLLKCEKDLETEFTGLPWDPSEHVMPEVEYAEKELNEMMRKYKENELNKDIFFEERKSEKMEEQRKENAKRRAELADKGQAELKDVATALESAAPIHPAEGGLREELD